MYSRCENSKVTVVFSAVLENWLKGTKLVQPSLTWVVNADPCGGSSAVNTVSGEGAWGGWLIGWVKGEIKVGETLTEGRPRD